MEDAVTLNASQSRAFFKHGFDLWSRHLHGVSTAPAAKELAQTCLSMIHYAFPYHPSWPSGLKLSKSSASWLATGASIWSTSADRTAPDSEAALCPGLPCLPPQKRTFVVTKTKPTRLSLGKELDINYTACSEHAPNNDHAAVLILAWAYILSARWAELISEAGPIQYTEKRHSTGQEDQSVITVPIHAVGDEAKRWWKAVLATGQGWRATVTNSDGSTLYSPWSTRLSSSQSLKPVFSEDEDAPTKCSGSAPDFATALGYLTEHYTFHHLEYQSCAALSTVLFLPLVQRNGMELPTPRILPLSTQAGEPRPQKRVESHQDCPTISQVDKLMALSCNTRGLESLLLSTFFDPDVPCNAVSPFLQGTFAVLDGISHDRTLLMHTLMHRKPVLGFLWMGAMISGCHEALLEKTRYGSTEVDILAAAWTGIISTFMQLPISTAASGRIRREDECRLAYLASAEYQSNIPTSPWKPFGSTALKDAELEVQIHTGCQGHGLQYRSWAWDCWKDGKLVHVEYRPTGLDACPYAEPRGPSLSDNVPPTKEVPYDKLCLEDDIASSTATLNIFLWLRRGGFATDEQHIRRHEWLCEVLDEEEEEAGESWPDDEGEFPVSRKQAKSDAPQPRIGKWLATREDSI